jgi:hypothetical protein
VIKCTTCGRLNHDTEKLCVYCGAPLIDLAKHNQTRAVGDTDYEEGIPKWGSARFNFNMTLVIHVVETRKSYVLDADEVEEIVLGRQDPDTGDAPNVDLTEAGAVDKGVSRRHATIMQRDGALHIVDNDSANGTYLNGQKLMSKQPRVLRDGDDVRLGHLVLRVNFSK